MNKLFKKFMEYAIGNGIVMLISLILVPLVSKYIGPEERGKVDLFVNYTSLLVLVFTMGMDQAFIRYYNNEEEDNRGKLLKRSIILPIVIALLGGVFLYVFRDFVVNLILVDKEAIKNGAAVISNKEAINLVVLLTANILISIVGNIGLINIRMKQKAKTYSLVSASNKIAYFFALFIFYRRFSGSYLTLLLTTITGNLMMVIVSMLAAKRDWFNFNKKYKLNTTTKQMITYGIPFIFSMAVTWIFQAVDKISIKSFSTLAEVGLYSGAMSIVAIINTVQGMFTTFWTPVAYEKYATDPEDRQFFAKISEVVSLAMLLVATGVIACKDIVILFLDAKYDGAQFIFPFLVLMPIMYTISETTVLGINFKKKTRYHIYIAITSAATNVIGNLILVPIWGAKGAAISTGLSYVIFFISRSYFANKFYKIDINYKKLFIGLGGVYILAIYSSFYKFNLTIFLMVIGVTALLLFLYRSLVKEILASIKKIVFKK